jgi:predicted dehydrogenase
MSHPKVRIAALCDVDRNRLRAAGARAGDARLYTDWREMLAKEGDRIDSVNVAIPDHMHAAVTVSALRAGKHVYCQKPLCHDVYECRAAARAAAAAGVVTQLGTQHASGIGDRMAVGYLREGAIGKVKHAYLCSNRPGVEGVRLAGPRPRRTDPVPEHVEWDLWLGTAPARPYVNGIYHPFVWRTWLDFGTGWSGDIGCHIFDALWKGLDLEAPKSVTAEVQRSWRESPGRRADTWPQSNHITWVFPGSDMTDGDLTVEWFDGEFYPPEEIRALAPEGMKAYPAESLCVVGTDGALLLPHTSGPFLLPRERFKGYPRPRLPGRNHYHHFADACLGGPAAESHFGRTGPMAEAIILGTVAIRCPGEMLGWDAGRMRVSGPFEAQRLLRRDYRPGWEVDGL